MPGRPGSISPTTSSPGACSPAISQSGGKGIARCGSEAIRPAPPRLRAAETAALLLPRTSARLSSSRELPLDGSESEDVALLPALAGP